MTIEGAFNKKIGVMTVALIQLTRHQIVDSDIVEFDFIFDFLGTFSKRFCEYILPKISDEKLKHSR